MLPTIQSLIGTLKPLDPPVVQSADDEAYAAAEWERRYGEPPRQIRDARDLLIAVGDCLVELGLEPDLAGDDLTFWFGGHVHRLTLEDLERRRPGPTDDELSLMSAGLAVG